MHGRIFVVLKESLKRIPVIGWGMQFAQFIFLKRKWEEDKPGLAKHMQRLNKPNDPMWLMMFPEGTNLASCTRETSRKWAAKNGIRDMKHSLLPRSTGLQFMLQELRQTVDYIYDCTIAYEGVPHGTFAQDVFTVGASYFGGRPPKSVNMYWRRFRISSIPLDNPQQFELWLRLRWREKDKFIDHYLRTGRFPADTGSNNNHKGECLHGSGHIEAEIKPKYWYEFLQVFAPIGLFALVLYLFYGALPQEMANKIKSIDQKTVMKQIEAIQKGEIKVPETKDLIATAPKDLQDKLKAVQDFAASQNTAPEKVIAEAKKALPAGVLPAGDSGPGPKPSTNATVKPQVASTPPKAPRISPSSLKASTVTKPQTSAPAKKPTAVATKSLQSTKKPLGAATGNVKRESPSGKAPSMASPQGKVALKSQKAKSVKKPEPVKPTGAGLKKTDGGTKAASAAPKQSSAVKPTPFAQQGGNNVEKDAVRHAVKKEIRQGKQEPIRKIRRALEASEAKD